MKTRKLLVSALITGLAFTACSNDDETVDMSNEIVRINASIGETASMLKATIDTDTGGGTFDKGDIWGMYAVVGGSRELDNNVYSVGSTQIFWNLISPTPTSLVSFTAYYPYSNTITNPEAYVFNAATESNSDLLVAPPVMESKSSGRDVNLTFKHAMHQLVIALDKSSEVTGNPLDAEITLLNMKSSAKVNLLTGTVDVAAASGTTNSYPMRTGGGIWLVAPQKLEKNTDWIQIKLAGKTYTYKVPAELTQLESGKRVTVTLILKGVSEVVSFGSATISEWVYQQPGIYDNVTGKQD